MWHSLFQGAKRTCLTDVILKGKHVAFHGVADAQRRCIRPGSQVVGLTCALPSARLPAMRCDKQLIGGTSSLAASLCPHQHFRRPGYATLNPATAQTSPLTQPCYPNHAVPSKKQNRQLEDSFSLHMFSSIQYCRS